METISNPNFSIILPGGCNCNCDFCFWRKDKHQATNNDVFFNALANALDYLPEQFNQLSITGGEPTISPVFHKVLELIADKKTLFTGAHKWTKVVLTTNGSNLKSYLDKFPNLFDRAVDFVNISRHSEFHETNNGRFGLKEGTKVLPNASQIAEINETLNKMGKKSTANYVLRNGRSHQPNEFIRWAKQVDFSEVCFRKQHQAGCNLEPTIYEDAYEDYEVVSHSECPVCRTDTQIIQGIPVVWTASIPEPSQELDLIYEAILHADGTLSADWSKQIELEL